MHDILDSGVRRADSRHGGGVTPGGVLVYGDQGQDVATLAFGRTHIEPPDTAAPVTAQTLYDVASLTKPMATAAALMALDIDVDQPVAPWLPELGIRGAERITFAHLLGHASGFPAHIEFFRRLLSGERAGAATARDALLRMVCATELDREPGQSVVYSDLGYIALGFVVERITGKRLDAAVRDLVTAPLGMDDTFFVDLTGPGLPAEVLARVAATEICPVRGRVHGQVHDDNAHAGGGIFGHAGLFATAGDVARFARAIIAALHGQTVAGFTPEAVARFTTTSAAPGATWRLGWDRPAPLPAVSHAGDLWPRDGVGHLGFTGCALWLDAPRGRYVVLLTNRVHPSREPPGILQFRRAVMDAVVTELDAG